MTFIPVSGPRTIFEADFTNWLSGVTDFISAGDGVHSIGDGARTLDVETAGKNRASTFDIDATNGIRLIHSGSSTSDGVLSAANPTTGSPRINISMEDILPSWGLKNSAEVWLRVALATHTGGSQAIGLNLATTPWSATNNLNIAMGVSPQYFSGNNQTELIQRTEGSNTKDAASGGTNFTTNTAVVLVCDAQHGSVHVYAGAFGSDWPALSSLVFWGSLQIPTNAAKIFDSRPAASNYGLMLGVASTTTASVNTYAYLRQMRVRL